MNYAFTRKKILIDELCIPERILHIDSKVLGEAESQEEAISLNGSESFAEGEQDEEPTEKLSRKEKAEFLRRQVDTVGKEGKAGEKIQNVISVGMLSEGWDARTVTHIMGLRAFSSQLLCEQVVGRGLRRTSYEINPETNLYESEYVNIFGVPFTFLPHEAKEDGPHPRTSPPKKEIKPVDEKRDLGMRWPNVIRIDHVFREELRLDLSRVKTLELDAYKTPTLVEMAPIVDGKPDFSRLSEIDLLELGKKNRWQRIVFQTSSDIFDHMKPS